MVSDKTQTRIVEMLEDNGNRMTLDEAAEELNERVGAITYNVAMAKDDIEDATKVNKNLAKDRFGGKTRVEKVVY